MRSPAYSTGPGVGVGLENASHIDLANLSMLYTPERIRVPVKCQYGHTDAAIVVAGAIAIMIVSLESADAARIACGIALQIDVGLPLSTQPLSTC